MLIFPSMVLTMVSKYGKYEWMLMHNLLLKPIGHDSTLQEKIYAHKIHSIRKVWSIADPASLIETMM